MAVALHCCGIYSKDGRDAMSCTYLARGLDIHRQMNMMPRHFPNSLTENRLDGSATCSVL